MYTNTAALKCSYQIPNTANFLFQYSIFLKLIMIRKNGKKHTFQEASPFVSIQVNILKMGKIKYVFLLPMQSYTLVWKQTKVIFSYSTFLSSLKSGLLLNHRRLLGKKQHFVFQIKISLLSGSLYSFGLYQFSGTVFLLSLFSKTFRYNSHSC